MKLEGKAKLLRIHFGEVTSAMESLCTKPLWRNAGSWTSRESPCTEDCWATAPVRLIRRSHILPFTHEAPILVQIVEREENIQKLLPFLDAVVGEGLIAISDVEVIKAVGYQT